MQAFQKISEMGSMGVVVGMGVDMVMEYRSDVSREQESGSWARCWFPATRFGRASRVGVETAWRRTSVRQRRWEYAGVLDVYIGFRPGWKPVWRSRGCEDAGKLGCWDAKIGWMRHAGVILGSHMRMMVTTMMMMMMLKMVVVSERRRPSCPRPARHGELGHG